MTDADADRLIVDLENYLVKFDTADSRRSRELRQLCADVIEKIDETTRPEPKTSCMCSTRAIPTIRLLRPTKTYPNLTRCREEVMPRRVASCSDMQHTQDATPSPACAHFGL